MPYPPGRTPYLVGTSCAFRTLFSCTIHILVGKNSLYILPKALTPVSRKSPLFSFRAIVVADWSKMSSQESVGESRVSNPTPEPRANSDADHFGPSTEEEMEADLKRVDAMEEDQEVTSRLQARFMMRNFGAHQFQTRSSLPMLDFFLMKI